MTIFSPFFYEALNSAVFVLASHTEVWKSLFRENMKGAEILASQTRLGMLQANRASVARKLG
ncbi:MAG: hypothetical protein ABI977_21230, partial [Acidobacteriota bacterium]